MNTDNGNLITSGEFLKLQQTEPKKAEKFIQVNRDLTIKESFDMQIKKYSPCGCGSGKKFKFCCFQKKK
jgi:uncharacterized protein YchJ